MAAAASIPGADALALELQMKQFVVAQQQQVVKDLMSFMQQTAYGSYDFSSVSPVDSRKHVSSWWSDEDERSITALSSATSAQKRAYNPFESAVAFNPRALAGKFSGPAEKPGAAGKAGVVVISDVTDDDDDNDADTPDETESAGASVSMSFDADSVADHEPPADTVQRQRASSFGVSAGVSSHAVVAGPRAPDSQEGGGEATGAGGDQSAPDSDTESDAYSTGGAAAERVPTGSGAGAATDNNIDGDTGDDDDEEAEEHEGNFDDGVTMGTLYADAEDADEARSVMRDGGEAAEAATAGKRDPSDIVDGFLQKLTQMRQSATAVATGDSASPSARPFDHDVYAWQ